jgi:hypothetical protein
LRGNHFTHRGGAVGYLVDCYDKRRVETDTTTIELLARWRAEEATDDPEEVRLAEQELAQFKKSMNQNRSQSGEPVVYP